MPTISSFDYAIIRVVPHVEREEFINAGVILFCRTQRFLAAEIALDVPRLRALAPAADVDCISANLNLIPRICAGDAEHPIGRLDQAERFHWLVTPRSTSVQVSAVHTGICTQPAETLAHLLQTVVKVG
jgi:hypothetical protein